MRFTSTGFHDPPLRFTFFQLRPLTPKYCDGVVLLLMASTRFHALTQILMYVFCLRRQKGNRLNLRRDLANVSFPRKENTSELPRKGEAAKLCFSEPEAFYAFAPTITRDHK